MTLLKSGYRITNAALRHPTPSMTRATLLGQVAEAVSACREKKAEEISILEMDKGAFTDFLVLCHGSNPRQVQAIADEVERRLQTKAGTSPNSIEGYGRAEWVLLDYLNFVVQIFDEERRRYYDLDRLWKGARRLSAGELRGKRAAKAVVKAKRTARAAPRRSSTRTKRTTHSARSKPRTAGRKK